MNALTPIIAALWLTPVQPLQRPFTTAAFLSREVTDRAVVRAVWRTTAGGVYEGYVNGSPIGGGILKPGFTNLWKTRQETTVEVTELFHLQAGATNVLCALVTEGWWRDDIVKGRGGAPIFHGELELTYADGTRETRGTSANWFAAYGSPLVRANIYDGEVYDARLDRAWMVTGEINPREWRPAKVDTRFQGVIKPMTAPVWRREDLVFKPRTVTFPLTIPAGSSRIFDFGQNCAAVPRFRARATRDASIVLETAEMLQDDGRLYRANLRSAKSRVVYTFADGNSVDYTPSFSFFGYRYVEVFANGAAVTLENLESVPVTSIAAADEHSVPDFGRDDLNRLATNVLWGLRSNYLSVPTDCPQRDERLGWTADTQVFALTATKYANVNAFLRKWLGDLRDEQAADGGYPCVAPWGRYGGETQRVGWSDAGIVVPYVLFAEYRDLAAVREHWASAKAFMALLRKTRYETPPRGWQYADWLSLEDLGTWETAWFRNFHGHRDWYWLYWNYLGGAYWLSDARMMREMAAALGERGDARQFAEDERTALRYLRDKFVGSDGRLIEPLRNLQTAMLFALKLGIVEKKGFDATKADLRANFKANGDRLKTGFLGTSILMDTLSQIGEEKLAFKILTSHEYPGWLYSVDQGATTVWERWDSYTKDRGFGDVSMNSFNHYAYGSVMGWLWNRLGRQSLPASRHQLHAGRP